MSEITKKTSSIKENPMELVKYNLTHELIYYRLFYNSFTDNDNFGLIPIKTYFYLLATDDFYSICIITKNDTVTETFDITHLIRYEKLTYLLHTDKIYDKIGYDSIKINVKDQDIIWKIIISLHIPENIEIILRKNLVFTHQFCKIFNMSTALLNVANNRYSYSYYIRLIEDDDEGVAIYMGKITNFTYDETLKIFKKILSEEIFYGRYMIKDNIISENVAKDKIESMEFDKDEHSIAMVKHISIIDKTKFGNTFFKFIIIDLNIPKKKDENIILPKKKKEKEKEEPKQTYKRKPIYRDQSNFIKLTSPFGIRRAEIMITSKDSDDKIIGRGHKISHVNEQEIDSVKNWTINYLNKNNRIAYFDIIYDKDNKKTISFLRRNNRTFVLNDWKDINIEIRILKGNRVYKYAAMKGIDIIEGNNIYNNDTITMEIIQYKTSSTSLWYIKYIILKNDVSNEPKDDKPIFIY